MLRFLYLYPSRSKRREERFRAKDMSSAPNRELSYTITGHSPSHAVSLVTKLALGYQIAFVVPVRVSFSICFYFVSCSIGDATLKF